MLQSCYIHHNNIKIFKRDLAAQRFFTYFLPNVFFNYKDFLIFLILKKSVFWNKLKFAPPR